MQTIETLGLEDNHPVDIYVSTDRPEAEAFLLEAGFIIKKEDVRRLTDKKGLEVAVDDTSMEEQRGMEKHIGFPPQGRITLYAQTHVIPRTEQIIKILRHNGMNVAVMSPNNTQAYVCLDPRYR